MKARTQPVSQRPQRSQASDRQAERFSIETSPFRRKAAAGALKIKDILVPTDFSDYANHALQSALDVARQYNARITLLYVVEPPVFTDIQGTFIPMDEQELIATAQRRLQQLKKELGPKNRYIRDTRVVVGKPFDQITSLARGLRQNLIIIATHGRTGIKHVLLGSTTEKVVRHATCPVLVVRGLPR